MLSKFLVLLAVPALATNDTASSSSDAASAASSAAASAASSSAATTASSSADATTTTTSGGNSSSTSTSSGNATTTTTSTTATTTLKSNTTAAPSTASTTKPAGGADGKKDGGKMEGKDGKAFGSGGHSHNGTNGTAATGGATKALTMPIVYKATVDEDVVSSAGKATCYTNIALLANTGVAVSVVDSACGNMDACGTAASTAKCCFKRDAPTATPTKLTECGTFSTTTYLYGLNSGCTLAARRRAEERRGLAGNATVEVTIDDKPMVEYNDADATLDAAMTVGATTFNSMSAADLNSKLTQMTKEVTQVIASGGTLMGMDVKQLTGDPAATATTYASVTSAATSATVTGEKGTAGVAVQATGSTSNAVAAAFSGLAFVFALLF